MNVYELEKRATPGRLSVDHDEGFWLYLDIETSASPRGKRVVAAFPDTADEAIALVKLLAHCRNNFMKALEALKKTNDMMNALRAQVQADHGYCKSVDLSDERQDANVKLIAELEEVK